MITLELAGNATKEIQRIKSEAEASPITVEQLQAKAESGDALLPDNLSTIIPQGWYVGYVIEQQPEPYGTWRRLRVTLDRKIAPPQEGIIKLMEAFGFECPPEECLWVPEPNGDDIVTICVMEPLEGRAKLLDFKRRMAIAEQISQAQGNTEWQ